MQDSLTRLQTEFKVRRISDSAKERRPISKPAGSNYRPKIPVLVLGTGLTALGVIRSFGRAGIPVFCLSEDIGIVARSKWFMRPAGNHKIVTTPDQLPAFLEQLPFSSAVLMPCSDAWVSAVAALPRSLASRYLTSQPSRETLDLLVDKGLFASALMRHGIAHPRTHLIESEEEFMRLDIDDFSGSFLKPHNSHDFFKFYSVKACRVTSKDDAIEQYRHKHADGFAVLFQEYVPGPSNNHYFIDGFVDRDGKIRALFARRRLRMFPVDFGNSTYMVSVGIDAVQQAADDLRRFLPAIGYRGIFSAEFKFDERDGLYKIPYTNLQKLR